QYHPPGEEKGSAKKEKKAPKKKSAQANTVLESAEPGHTIHKSDIDELFSEVSQEIPGGTQVNAALGKTDLILIDAREELAEAPLPIDAPPEPKGPSPESE